MSLIFSKNEFVDRTMRLQDQMALIDVDALLLTSAADIFYVTGFLTRFWESPARPWFIIVPRTRSPIAVIPGIGAALMARTWIDTIHTWDAPNPNDDGVSLLSETLCDVVPKSGKIGIAMGLETHLRMPLADFERLKLGISGRSICDGTAAIQRTREIKSEAEITKIRNTCAMANRAFDTVPDFAHRGSGLDQVFRDFQVACLSEGADWVSYVAGAAGAGGYSDVISPADSRPLRDGDVLMLDTGAVKDGYFCDFDRNFAIGHASDPVQKTHTALWYATERVICDLRPGHLASDAHRMLCDALIAKGVEPGGGRLGHGLGITLTEWPSMTPLDNTTLRSGMVLTLEPGAIVTPGQMIVHEENIVLRDDGPELLSQRAPEEIPVIT